MTIEDRVERLENKLDLIIKNLDLKDNSDKCNDIIYLEDLKESYKHLEFNSFYEKCKDYRKFINRGANESESKWAVDCIDGESMFSRIFLCLAWFDVDKIAEQITTINKSSSEKITYVGVKDVLSISEWKAALLDSLKKLVNYLIVYGEATEDVTYKTYQIGRIVLESIYMKYDGEGAVKLKLYFSDNNCEAYPDSWDD